MKFNTIRIWIALTPLLVSTAILIGCTTDSAESVIRTTGIIIEGYYTHPDAGSTLVGSTTGNPVTSLALRQTGDQLEAFDNNGIRFGGTLGQVIEGTRASFTLEGRSTSGEPATISGNIDVEGTTATMKASWIEPSLISTVYGVAVVPENTGPPVDTNETESVTLVPALVSILPSGTASFSASGGTGTYTWQVANTGIGNITGVSGTGNASATYSAYGIGENQVVVTDSSGDSARATVLQSTTGGETTPVTVSPTLTTINAFGGTATFAVSGGDGTYTWSLSDSNIGRITSVSGTGDNRATYTASTLGRNTLTVTDQSGESDNATIQQELIDDGGGGTPPIP